MQLTLQLNFLVALDTCNSPYLYVMRAIGQVAKVARIATHYNSIITLLQQLLFNYYATPLQLETYYRVDVIFHPSIKI